MNVKIWRPCYNKRMFLARIRRRCLSYLHMANTAWLDYYYYYFWHRKWHIEKVPFNWSVERNEAWKATSQFRFLGDIFLFSAVVGFKFAISIPLSSSSSFLWSHLPNVRIRMSVVGPAFSSFGWNVAKQTPARPKASLWPYTYAMRIVNRRIKEWIRPKRRKSFLHWNTYIHQKKANWPWIRHFLRHSTMYNSMWFLYLFIPCEINIQRLKSEEKSLIELSICEYKGKGEFSSKVFISRVFYSLKLK